MTAESLNVLRQSALKSRSLSLCLLMLLPAVLLGGVLRALAQPTGPVIDAIRITGNQRVETDAIRLHVSQPIGRPLDEATVDRDIKAIYRMNFFSRVNADLEHQGARTILVYHVQERPMVADVRTEGMKAVEPSDDKIVAAIKIHSGSMLDPSRVAATVRGIKEVYESKGYLDAKVTSRTVVQAGNTAMVILQVNEGPLARLTAIDFTGNKHFSDRRLRSVMESGPYSRLMSWLTGTGMLDRKRLASDTDRLTAFYYDHGYLNARLSEPIVKRHDNAMTVTIPIDEGPVYKVSSIDFSGDLKFPEKELRKEVEVKPGETFRGTRLQHDVLSISDFYSNLGYAYVTVDPRTAVNPANHTVAVTFAVNPGKQVLVDRINIAGNTKTSDKVIRRELLIGEQEPYSAGKIRESKFRLDRLGYFSQTHITTRPAPQPDEINLNLNVTEANTASFQLGGGFDSASSLFGNFTLGDTNLFGGGESLVFNAMVGFLFQNFSISYTEPWFLDLPLSVSLQLFSNKSFLISFNQSSAGIAINTGYPLEDLGLKKIGPLSMHDVGAGLGYTFESIGITGLSGLTPLEILRAKGFRQVSILTPSLRRFTVDNPIDPRTGSVQSLNIEFAGLGGTSQYLKSVLHLRWFFNFLKSPVWGSWVESPSLTFGIGTNLRGGTAGELPLFARFFPGGVGSSGDVRGYQVFSLGPQVITFDQLGQPLQVNAVGGSKELLLSNQVSFPLISALGIRGFVFTDAGNAYRLHAAAPLTSLQAAAGFGIFWRSPFGPISVDLGIPINPRPEDQSVIFDVGAGSL